MKKLLALLLTAVLAVGCVAFTGCSEDTRTKVGLITLHDENSTYDKNFIDAFKAACKVKNVRALIKTGVEEDASVETNASELVEAGCKLVFADSFGHEPYLRNAAKAYPEVQFAHATGTSTQTDKSLTNFHNAFASIYEGRYIAGYAAGLKLAAMYATNKAIAKEGVITVGYVGAYDYAEVKSGYTSWLLGVRAGFAAKVTDAITVNMIVEFTNSWYNEGYEKDSANALIKQGCVIISQHADSWGAPTACETAKVPNVSYNGSTESRCPETFIISSRVNWQPYFEYIIDCVLNNKKIDDDWCGELGSTFANGSVALTELGKKAPVEGTQAELDKVAAALRNGSLKIFDTSKFTVKGGYAGGEFANLTDVKFDENGKLLSAKQNGLEVVKTTADGITYFAESDVKTNRSAPYFDVDIDGIKLSYRKDDTK